MDEQKTTINKLAELKMFSLPCWTDEHQTLFFELANQARIDLLTALQISGSGHAGGSLSSLDLFLMLWLVARVEPEHHSDPERDRIVISHGHTAAGVYAVLGNLNYFTKDAYISSFRKDGSPFEGHPSLQVPGVEWCSGSLGQGLSVGCGMALAAKMKQMDYRVFVAMGDGEQAKGQLQEAREFAVKYRLGNLIAIVDSNGLQASGRVEDIMPQKIARKYDAAGWRVLPVDGHDPGALYRTLQVSYNQSDIPTVILAQTIMGKGIAAIEGRYEYHGKALTPGQFADAYRELARKKTIVSLDCAKKISAEDTPAILPVEERVRCGKVIIYPAGKMIECRSAFGEAIVELAQANRQNNLVIAAIDCDLAESVRLESFRRHFPEWFIECGLQEHHAATMAGALSRSDILTFFTDFAVFGIDEVYGQHRMNDMNRTSIKLIGTHCGLDVGEDGKTHQCIDYLGLLANLYRFQVILPADANQIGFACQYMATHPGNMALLMGRSKMPVLTNETGKPFFDTDYRFVYGRADWIRQGNNGTIITYGNLAARAVEAHEKLKKLGYCVGILNISCPTDLDTGAVLCAARTGLIVVYEDHNKKTGLGSQIGAWLAEHSAICRFKCMGIEQYGLSAEPQAQYRQQGLAVSDLVNLVINELQKPP